MRDHLCMKEKEINNDQSFLLYKIEGLRKELHGWGKNRSVSIFIVEKQQIRERKRSEKMLESGSKVTSLRTQQSESC